MFELEKKVLLSAREYKILCKKFNTSKPAVQINYYYDTPSLDMNRSNTTCRIRKRNGICTATVKTHNLGSRDRSIERSQRVKNEYDACLFADSGMVLQGSLKTERASITRYPGIRIDIDKNTYLGFTDYELEIEYTPESGPSCSLLLNQISEFLGYSLNSRRYEDFIFRTQYTAKKPSRCCWL